jgi:4-amino-4-deoxy-L-arabinose transferase-like glycosyltransferase
MQTTHLPRPLRPPLNVLAYLGAAALFIYAAMTIRSDPRGLLDLGTWLSLSALLALAAYLHTAQQRTLAAARDWATRHGLRLPLLALAAGLGVLAAARFAIYLRFSSDFVGVSERLWAAACIALVGAAWPARPLALRAWIAMHRRDVLLVGALTLVAAALRFWRLGSIPRIINGDEGLIGTWALDIGKASGALTMPFAAMDGVGTLYLALMQDLFLLLGPTPFALRLLPALAGILAVPALYVLARRLVNPRAALVATTFLVISHVHIHFSRTVAVSYIYATLFVPLALYFLLSGMERRSPIRMVLSVLMVGLHINTYVDGWVWLVLLLLVLAGWAVVDRSIFRGNRVQLAVFALSLAVIVTPMVIWAVRFPAAFGSRMSLDGTFASGWLAQEAAATGKHQAQIVAELFLAALGTFTQRPFLDFYGVGVPTLDPLSGVLWMIGLPLALWRARSRHMLVLNGWFWGGVVALGVVTIPPSTYHYRLLVVLPAAAILIGLAADTLLTRGEQLVAQEWQRRTSAVLITAALLVIAQSNFTTYFDTFIPACKYHSFQTRQAGLLGKYLHTMPRETAVFVLPLEHGFRAGPFLSVDFLSGRMAVENIDAPLEETAPEALAGQFPNGLLVAAVPERAGELERVAAWFPGGSQKAILDCGQEALSVYDWRPTASAAQP